MTLFIKFLKTSLVGGILFFLPAGLTLVALHWLLEKIVISLKPIVGKIEILAHDLPSFAYYLIAISIIMTVFFMVGVMIQTGFGGWISQSFHNLMSKLPFYKQIKTITSQLAGEESPFKSGKAGLVKLFGDEVDTELWCVKMAEDKELGVCTVFCMSAPTPFSGYIYNVKSKHFREVDGVGVDDVIRLTLACGIGSKEFFGKAYGVENKS